MDITEGIKKVFLAGVGAVATTGEAAKNLIDNLVEKGELTVEQGKVLNEEFKKETKEKMTRHVTVNVVNEFRDVFSSVDKMSKEELEELKARLDSVMACDREETCDCEEKECCCGTEETCEEKKDETQE